jgi:hypothetical protein
MQAERMVQATAGLDPALARLAGQNAARVAELEATAEQGDRLDAEQQESERLAARTRASLERMQAAKEVGLPTEAWARSCWSSVPRSRMSVSTRAGPATWGRRSPRST